MSRVCTYLRVSTGRQAGHDLSIPDQRQQATDHCARRGWEVAREFVEPGASGTEENRPAFQAMIEFVTGPDHPVDIILVHSFSRFFRDAFLSEFYIRRLRKAGVRLESVTQESGDDPTGELVRKVIALFDEHSSRENAKHVLRCMKRNAEEGFWNGSRPPFGYRTVVKEMRGEKAKKVLQVDPDEAAVVQAMFRMVLQGEPGRGPMGVKAITCRLNESGVTLRGRRFHVANVHDILTRTTYVGRHHFNTMDSRTKQRKPAAERVPLAVPAIISEAEFTRVGAILAARNPRKTPPRVVSGPTLLTGVAVCASCGGGMTLRTGKSGRYRYYTCSTCARMGKTACRGRSVRMDRLDEMVLAGLRQRLLHPEHLSEALEPFLARDAAAEDARRERLAERRRELAQAEDGARRLLQLVEAGLADLDDPLFRDRLAQLRLRREELTAEIRLAERRGGIDGVLLTPERLQAFSAILRDGLGDDDRARQRTFLHGLVQHIEVDDEEIRVSGSKAALARWASEPDPAAMPTVPSFVREWRARQDSNL